MKARLAQAGSDISLGGSGSSLALNRAAFQTDMEERLSRIRRNSLLSLASLSKSEEGRWLRICSYQSRSVRLEMRGLTSNKISIGILVRFSSLPLRFLCRVVWLPSSLARLLRDEFALLPVTVPLSMMARRRTPTSLHVIGDVNLKRQRNQSTY